MSDLYTTYHVTPEQVDSCTRVIDEATGEVFYIVPSAHEQGVTYKVQWNKAYSRFACTCVGNSVHGTTCWHLRAVLVAATQYAEEAEARALEEARQAEAEAQALRVAYHSRRGYSPRASSVNKAQERNEPRAFSILRVA